MWKITNKVMTIRLKAYFTSAIILENDVTVSLICWAEVTVLEFCSYLN